MARRKTTPKLPEQDAIHLPEPKQQRNMLKNALEQIQNQGFDAHINLIVVEAQTGRKVTLPDGQGGARRVDKVDQVKDLKETIANSKRAAVRLEREIAKLPEEPEPDEDNEPDIKPEEDAKE